MSLEEAQLANEQVLRNLVTNITDFITAADQPLIKLIEARQAALIAYPDLNKTDEECHSFSEDTEHLQEIIDYLDYCADLCQLLLRYR